MTREFQNDCHRDLSAHTSRKDDRNSCVGYPTQASSAFCIPLQKPSLNPCSKRPNSILYGSLSSWLANQALGNVGRQRISGKKTFRKLRCSGFASSPPPTAASRPHGSRQRRRAACNTPTPSFPAAPSPARGPFWRCLSRLSGGIASGARSSNEGRA